VFVVGWLIFVLLAKPARLRISDNGGFIVSTFHDMARASAGPRKEPDAGVWQEQFPRLWEALWPPLVEGSRTKRLPRFTVTVFSHQGALKCVVSSREQTDRFFLTLDGPEAVLEQIELALASGKGEWRDEKNGD
jgi:hypothetical protein